MDIKKLPKSLVQIDGEIPYADLKKYESGALKRLGSDLVIDGFRKGHVPEKVAREKIGEMRLLNEMAEMALSDLYPEIVIKNKIDPIAHPEISITKIALNNPLGFKITVPVMPSIKLPEYKKIAEDVISKKEKVEVLKEDTENIINQVLDSKKDKDGKRPELTDDFVKTLGDFSDLKDFHLKVGEGVRKEKELRAKEKVRVNILENIISKTEIDLPDVVIQSELEKMIATFKGDIERMGLKVDEYLKNINKTIDDLKVEWKGEAEKRGKSQLIINQIAIVEKLYPKKEDVQKETEHLLTHYKDADKNRLRVYVETILTNEEVMKFLENSSIEKEKEKE